MNPLNDFTGKYPANTYTKILQFDQSDSKVYTGDGTEITGRKSINIYMPGGGYGPINHLFNRTINTGVYLFSGAAFPGSPVPGVGYLIPASVDGIYRNYLITADIMFNIHDGAIQRSPSFSLGITINGGYVGPNPHPCAYDVENTNPALFGIRPKQRTFSLYHFTKDAFYVDVVWFVTEPYNGVLADQIIFFNSKITIVELL